MCKCYDLGSGSLEVLTNPPSVGTDTPSVGRHNLCSRFLTFVLGYSTLDVGSWASCMCKGLLGLLGVDGR